MKAPMEQAGKRPELPSVYMVGARYPGSLVVQHIKEVVRERLRHNKSKPRSAMFTRIQQLVIAWEGVALIGVVAIAFAKFSADTYMHERAAEFERRRELLAQYELECHSSMSHIKQMQGSMVFWGELQARSEERAVRWNLQHQVDQLRRKLEEQLHMQQHSHQEQQTVTAAPAPDELQHQAQQGDAGEPVLLGAGKGWWVRVRGGLGRVLHGRGSANSVNKVSSGTSVQGNVQGSESAEAAPALSSPATAALSTSSGVVAGQAWMETGHPAAVLDATQQVSDTLHVVGADGSHVGGTSSSNDLAVEATGADEAVHTVPVPVQQDIVQQDVGQVQYGHARQADGGPSVSRGKSRAQTAHPHTQQPHAHPSVRPPLDCHEARDRIGLMGMHEAAGAAMHSQDTAEHWQGWAAKCDEKLKRLASLYDGELHHLFENEVKYDQWKRYAGRDLIMETGWSIRLPAPLVAMLFPPHPAPAPTQQPQQQDPHSAAAGVPGGSSVQVSQAAVQGGGTHTPMGPDLSKGGEAQLVQGPPVQAWILAGSSNSSGSDHDHVATHEIVSSVGTGHSTGAAGSVVAGDKGLLAATAGLSGVGGSASAGSMANNAESSKAGVSDEVSLRDVMISVRVWQPLWEAGEAEERLVEAQSTWDAVWGSIWEPEDIE